MELEKIFPSCVQKQKDLLALFPDIEDADCKYQKIIELGRNLPAFSEDAKTPENLVTGCQSIMYLASSIDLDGNMHFFAFSEALISKGLAALLLFVYNEENPETVLKCTPFFLEKLNLDKALSPGRSSGLTSMYMKMKKEALKHLLLLQNRTI